MPGLTLTLPGWVRRVLAAHRRVRPTARERMRVVVDLARRNLGAGGGPFAAAVFDTRTGALVAAGVNLVLPGRCFALHAEMIALVLAARRRGAQSSGRPVPATCELVTSAEPCAMCLGAVVWAGVRRVVCGAREADARRAGFDEGPKPRDWARALRARGIRVLRDVRRAEAAAVIRDYAAAGGVIYNGQRRVAGRPATQGTSGVARRRVPRSGSRPR